MLILDFRSNTFLTVLSPLRVSQFNDQEDTKVKDVIDQWRAERARAIAEEGVDPLNASRMKYMDFEGHGVLFVAKETVKDNVPLCLAIGDTGNKIELLPCFEEWVPPSLAKDWETGAVILRETMPHTRWTVGPCTSDGKLERLYVSCCCRLSQVSTSRLPFLTR
jgi:hypothetical protein